MLDRYHAARRRPMLTYDVRPLSRSAPTAPTRQVVAAALTLVVLGGVGAVKAGLAGSDFMFDLERPPALATVAPALPDPHWPRLARRVFLVIFFFSSRRRHTRLQGDWSSDVCSSD